MHDSDDEMSKEGVEKELADLLLNLGRHVTPSFSTKRIGNGPPPRNMFEAATSTSNLANSSVLSAKKLNKMMAAVSEGMYDTVDLPEEPNNLSSWALALSTAFLAVFNVRFSEGGPSAFSSSFSQPSRLDMTFPLGKHRFQTSSAFALSDGMPSTTPRKQTGTELQNTLNVRQSICKEMIRKQLEPIEVWIDIAKNATKYTVKDILALKNIEQRMAALRIFGADRLIQETQAVLVDKSKRGNELYLIPRSRGLFDTDAYSTCNQQWEGSQQFQQEYMTCRHLAYSQIDLSLQQSRASTISSIQRHAGLTCPWLGNSD